MHREANDIILALISFFKEIGYQYITPQQATDFRGTNKDMAILEHVFMSQVRTINNFQYKGETIGFSEENILAAISTLKNEALREEFDSRNKRVFDTLMVGKTFEESIHGDKKSFLLKYIDWENFNNNSFHVTDEFEILSNGNKICLDLVLFVNGIPLVIIETNNKIWKAQEQHDRMSVSFSLLYQVAQILIAVDPTNVLYSTAGNYRACWRTWRTDTADGFFDDKRMRHLDKDHLLLYQQIYPLTKPDKLLELIKYFIFYNGSQKRIANYYQYYAVKKTINRLAEESKKELNKRGVIVQPTGTGKLRTMLVLSDYILRSKKSPHTKILLIVDNLKTFNRVSEMFSRNTLGIGKAKSSEELYSLLRNPYVPVVVSTIQKFNYLFDEKWSIPNTHDFFILIDEIQRGYVGILGNKLFRFFSNSAVIGFTGFPASEKVLAAFQTVIYQYTFEAAVEDGNLVSIIYEHRPIDIELKRRTAYDRLGEDPIVIEKIAEDIFNHYKGPWKSRQAKAVLVTPSVYAATLYKQYFDKTSTSEWHINTATYLIAAQPTYSGGIAEPGDILEMFNDPSDKVQILIVVNALDTGIQINPSILYVAKPLNKRTIISSISPIMRLSGVEKIHGLVIDYIGISEDLNELFEKPVVTQFNAERSRQLGISYDQLEKLFTNKFNLGTLEALEHIIRSDSKRSLFLERFSLFEKSLLIIQSFRDEISQYSETEIDFYERKLMFFRNVKELVLQYKTDKNEELIKRLQTYGKNSENISANLVAEPTEAYRTSSEYIYQALKTILLKHGLVFDEKLLFEFGCRIEQVIKNNAVRDWKANIMAINKMKNAVDDVLFKFLEEHKISFNYEIIDALLSSIIFVAKHHY